MLAVAAVLASTCAVSAVVNLLEQHYIALTNEKNKDWREPKLSNGHVLN